MAQNDDLAPPGTLRLPSGEGKGKLSVQETHLVVQDGERAGTQVPCGSRPLKIGSAPDNDLVLRDPGISRHHAVIENGANGLLLRDMGSTNGTFVNEVQVKEAFVQPGAVLRLGRVSMRVEMMQRAAAIPPYPGTKFGLLVGQSQSMRQLFTVLDWVAPTDATVLIGGPTGTGKDMVARSLHLMSTRKDGPLVVLDCGAVDPQLLSSELFGHEAGAFTGAAARRAGVFEQAKGGTVFIDEVGELPLDVQPKLLRVLEAREVRRLGSNQTLPVDVRVVAATNRALDKMVIDGKFREDLYYRLCQVQVALPPLDDRREDLPLLIEALLDRLPAGVSKPKLAPDAQAFLMSASFPGNVRQLRNVIERAAMVARGATIELAHLLVLGTELKARPTGPTAALSPMPEVDDKTRITQALAANGQVLARTAKALGIAINTLKSRMRKYGIPFPSASRPGGAPGDEGDEGDEGDDDGGEDTPPA